MSKLFVSKRTRAAAWVILLVLPALMVAYGYYQGHRPTVNLVGSRTFWDYLILSSDILLGLLFLIASSIPFILVFDKKKPQAREMVPIAVMAAIAVVGRTVFSIIPLPNFKPCSAVIIITAIAFGPEAGFLTGALTGFVSNFIFGQGPWTPWQMFTWGLVGFLAGILKNAGVLRKRTAPTSRQSFGTDCARRIRTGATCCVSCGSSPTTHRCDCAFMASCPAICMAGS